MGPDEFNAVADWLDENSRLPRMANRLWRQIHRFVHPESGEILRSRDELAELIGVTPREISTVMNELARINAVYAERVRIPGMRGPGAVRWFLHPCCGTHLPKEPREVVQAASPKLRLVESA